MDITIIGIAATMGGICGGLSGTGVLQSAVAAGAVGAVVTSDMTPIAKVGACTAILAANDLLTRYSVSIETEKQIDTLIKTVESYEVE